MKRMTKLGILTSLGLLVWACGGTQPEPTKPVTPVGKGDSTDEITVDVVQMLTTGCAAETCKLPAPEQQGDKWVLQFGFSPAPSGEEADGRWVRGAFITPSRLLDYYTAYSSLEEVYEEFEVDGFNGLCEEFQDKWGVWVQELTAAQGLPAFIAQVKVDFIESYELIDWFADEEGGDVIAEQITRFFDALEQGEVTTTSISHDFWGDLDFTLQAGIAGPGAPRGEAETASAKVVAEIRERLGTLLNPALRDRVLAQLKEGTFLHFRIFDTSAEMWAREYFVILPKGCSGASCPGAIALDVGYSEVD